MTTGCEWVVDATGCEPATLTSLPGLESLFDDLIKSMDLHPAAKPQWKRFEGAGGITGLVLLEESHLAVHTFPEHGSLCLNLFCCRKREGWNFMRELMQRFGAKMVQVRYLERNFG